MFAERVAFHSAKVSLLTSAARSRKISAIFSDARPLPAEVSRGNLIRDAESIGLIRASAMQKCRGSSGGFETARGVLPAKPGGVGGGGTSEGMMMGKIHGPWCLFNEITLMRYIAIYCIASLAIFVTKASLLANGGGISKDRALCGFRDSNKRKTHTHACTHAQACACIIRRFVAVFTPLQF